MFWKKDKKIEVPDLKLRDDFVSSKEAKARTINSTTSDKEAKERARNSDTSEEVSSRDSFGYRESDRSLSDCRSSDSSGDSGDCDGGGD